MKWFRRRVKKQDVTMVLGAPRRPTRRETSPQKARAWRKRFRKLFRMADDNRRIRSKAPIASQGVRDERAERPQRPSRIAAALRRARPYAGRGVAYLLMTALFAGLPLGLFMTWRHLLRTPHFLVRQVEVEGNHRVSAKDIVRAAGLDRPVSTLLVDEDALALAVRAEDWIRTADVEVTLPQKVRIRVTERQPAALLALGSLYLVDERGIVFRRLRPDESFDLPIVTGFERSELTDPTRQAETRDRLREALTVLRAYATLGLDRVAPLSEISCDVVYGHVLRTEAEGAEIWLGKDRYAEKLGRLADVMADVALQGQTLRRVYLDAPDALSRVVVRADDPSLPIGGREVAAAGASEGERTP